MSHKCNVMEMLQKCHVMGMLRKCNVMEWKCKVKCKGQGCFLRMTDSLLDFFN